VICLQCRKEQTAEGFNLVCSRCKDNINGKGYRVMRLKPKSVVVILETIGTMKKQEVRQDFLSNEFSSGDIVHELCDVVRPFMTFQAFENLLKLCGVNAKRLGFDKPAWETLIRNYEHTATGKKA